MIRSKKLSRFKNIEHAFFNRLGGESVGVFKSLNCGPGSSDNKKNVIKNLKTVRNKIKSKTKKIFLLNQVHSNKFYYINKSNLTGQLKKMFKENKTKEHLSLIKSFIKYDNFKNTI